MSLSIDVLRMRKKMVADAMLNIHPRPFYIDRELLMSIAIPNIDKTKTLKEVGTSISHTIIKWLNVNI